MAPRVNGHQRSLSYTEITTALTCLASWDFSYGGRLAGTTLKPRQVLPILSEGRAWGAGVAAWHHQADRLLAPWAAETAIHDSLTADIEQMTEAGVMIDGALTDRFINMGERLESMMRHYAATVEPLANLTRLEDTIDVALPSRTGRRASTRYRFGAKIDGFTVDEHEHEWIVEFKLRGGLHDRQVIELMRQYRWYAWARQRETGRPVVGLILDERLNEAPKPVRVLKSGKPSHDKSQLTTADMYEAACEDAGEDPHSDVLEALRSRCWQQRVAIPFRPSELEEAGRELVASAWLIGRLDSGELWPIRNAKVQICRSCRFLPVCANPQDDLYVNQLFSRGTPKREKTNVGRADAASDALLSPSAAETSVSSAGSKAIPELEEAPF